jgi:transcriptional regulator with XRE-family HTH domain
MRTVARCTDEKVRQTIAIPDRQLGQRLRRFRRLRGLKQEHVAQILGVSQGLISRWEAGKHVPSPEISHQIRRFISVAPDSVSDRALRRLVEAANVPVHLICDATHRLLAASPLREDEWRASAHAFIGSSLWRQKTGWRITAGSIALILTGYRSLPKGTAATKCASFPARSNGSGLVWRTVGWVGW